MSNMKPAGYLNKFTGMIWNPEQQPGADSEPEIYEPLVRLSDVHGLVAERDALAKSIDKMADIGDMIKSQDNRCTDQPFFAVLTKRELPAAEDYDYDRIIFVHPDRDYEEADDRTYRRLEALDEGGRDLRGWQRLAVKKVEEFRVGCFTEQGCKDYISRNRHNLNEPFIFAYGSYRNNEFQEVRNFLIESANLRAGGKG